jgi:hypothetical protein
MTLTWRSGGVVLGRVTDIDVGTGLVATYAGGTGLLTGVGAGFFAEPGGRLTLTSGTPVTSSDVTSATTIYYTPYLHNNVWLYTAGVWTHYTFSEITIALGTLTAGSIYDIFLYDSSGVVTAKIGPAWSPGNGTRGTGAGTTELAQQDGTWVNNVAISGGPGAKNGLYVGSFYTISTTATADSGGDAGTSQVGGQRYLNNMYHRVPGTLKVRDTSDSWSYTTGVVRSANGAAGNMVSFIITQPQGGEYVEVHVQSTWNGANTVTRGASIGIGLDSSATFTGTVTAAIANPSSNGFTLILTAFYAGFPTLGYRELNWNESGSDGSGTFYGDNGTSVQYSGLIGWKLR